MHKLWWQRRRNEKSKNTLWNDVSGNLNEIDLISYIITRIFTSCDIQVSTCSKCGGLGKIITDHCRKCDGSGQLQAKRTMEVAIPPGLNDGDTMRIRGEGNYDKNRLAACPLMFCLYLYTLLGSICNTWICSTCKFSLILTWSYCDLWVAF